MLPISLAQGILLEIMPFSQFTAREQVGRFWPFFLLLSIAILYRIRIDLSTPSPMLCLNEASQVQAHIHSPSMTNFSSTKPLPYPVILALTHYATTSVTPLLTHEEIMVTANILSQRAPCNFLIFGLGYDSQLWQTLNYGGNTIFLEDEANWIADMERSNPDVRAIHVKYTTKVAEAEGLLTHARREKEICSPAIDLRISECKLAMRDLPEEIYAEKWDVVMIDLPKGYFEEAPGRMSPIFTAAIMAKGRGKLESTHILLHNVDRAMERDFSTEFFCSKNLIGITGKLGHFQIYGDGLSRSSEFCTTSIA